MIPRPRKIRFYTCCLSRNYRPVSRTTGGGRYHAVIEQPDRRGGKVRATIFDSHTNRAIDRTLHTSVYAAQQSVIATLQPRPRWCRRRR